MKKFLLVLFCFSFLMFKVNANESLNKSGDTFEQRDESETKETDEIKIPKENEPVDFKGYFSKYKKTRIKAKTSPKLEHLKTKVQTEEDLKKIKQEFQERKEKELMLLNEEYEILDYKPHNP